MNKIPMTALMSIPSMGLARGATFEADDQTARDLERAGRAERTKPEPAPAKAKA